MSSCKQFKVSASLTAGFLMLLSANVGVERALGASLTVGKKDIGGVVTSSKGPEAGVWVVAETKDLPTKFTRIVVTDDQGRYLIPDLPQASYQGICPRLCAFWIRNGSQPLSAKSWISRRTSRQTPRAPHRLYPAAASWLSLMKLPGR